MDEKEYKAFGDKVEDGYSYTSFTCEPRIYLPWLAMKIIRRGGKIIKRKITDLSEVSEFHMQRGFCTQGLAM